MKLSTRIAVVLPFVITMGAAMAQEAIPPLPRGTISSGLPIAVEPASRAVPQSRAEKLADLQIYRESGLPQLMAADVAPTSVQYLQAEQRYVQLRASDYFASLVQRYSEGTTHSAFARQ